MEVVARLSELRYLSLKFHQEQQVDLSPLLRLPHLMHLQLVSQSSLFELEIPISVPT